MSVPLIFSGIAALLLVTTSAGENKTWPECPSDLAKLEDALYNYNPQNIINLNKIFYPPRESPSRFIKVTYIFENYTNCNITYIWAIGGFLLIQPPTIFQLTSLYFSSPANSLTDLDLWLPNDCQPLARNKENNCTCDNEDNILDILTQQVHVINTLCC